MTKIIRNGIEYREWEQDEDFGEYLKNSPDNWHETYWNWAGWDDNKSYSENLHLFYCYFGSYEANTEQWYAHKKGISKPLKTEYMVELWDTYLTLKFEVIKQYLK